VRRILAVSARAAVCAALAAGAGIGVDLLTRGWPPILGIGATGLAVLLVHLGAMRLAMHAELSELVRLVTSRLHRRGRAAPASEPPASEPPASRDATVPAVASAPIRKDDAG
jgi:hypothetical protein